MHPMLTDFGIARLADSPGLTRTHEFVGTPAYVAPESAEGRPQTSAVDIYGAGILLYELVTGRPPFAGGSALEVLHRHLSEEPRRPTTVPEPLWTVMERCLRKDPSQRPSAENLARGLRTVAAGIGVHSSSAQVEAALGVAALLGPDPSPGARPGHPERRRPHPGAAEQRRLLRPERRRPACLPQTSGPGAGRAADPTSVMPPVPPGAGQPEPAPLAVPAAGGPRPQRADAGPVPRPEPGPAAPASAAPAAAAAAPAAVRAAAVPAAAASAAAAAPGPASAGAAAPAPAAAVRPAAAAVRAPAAAAAPAARAAPAEAAQRQPDADPRPRLPQGLPVHR